MSSRREDVASNLANLTLKSTKKSAQPSSRKSKTKVADSWEDESVSSEADSEDSEDSDGGSHVDKQRLPSAPPPTPITATYQGQAQAWDASNSLPPSSSSTIGARASLDPSSPRRPEKTDAVARRMIAGALGLKAPKRTEEQKAYEKAIREQEMKRKADERAAEKKKAEDVAKAKAAVWDD